jgi:hypothetical protein
LVDVIYPPTAEGSSLRVCAIHTIPVLHACMFLAPARLYYIAIKEIESKTTGAFRRAEQSRKLAESKLVFDGQGMATPNKRGTGILDAVKGADAGYRVRVVHGETEEAFYSLF